MHFFHPFKIIKYTIVLCIVSLCCYSTVLAKDIIDMTGRVVGVPESIKTVYAASPPETMLIYALDPTLLAGLNFPLKSCSDKYINTHTLSLPILGGYFGQGKTPNLEKLVKLNPDIVIGRKSNPSNSKFESFLDKFNIPIAYIIIDELDQYPKAFEVAGEILNRKSRAKVLSEYTRKTLLQVYKKTSSIPQHEKLKVYYAEGNDGLSTENCNSIHGELINLAGGSNVHQDGVFTRYGKEKVTIETVIKYQPEVIFVDQVSFFKKIFSSPNWKSIPAVKNKRVYLTPKVPFNWFDRPPSFMRILGLKWVAKTLYPDLYDWDMKEETQEFFDVFLQKKITSEDAANLLDTSK